jgi:TolB-like protein/DNA-binding SARP family transcriptional activator/Tfp pilus assembly protein PilF
MLEIRLLGGFALSLPNGSTPGRLGLKPQGLLAVLAMSRGQLLTRSRLAGLLWGERDEDLARHSLSQALTTVRAALGPTASDIVVADPEGLYLAKDRLKLDVDDFEIAVRIGRRDTLEDAFGLYRGEFLDGLEIREPAFEEWMLTERYRLDEVASGAFARLLDLQTTAGDADAAVDTARRLVALTPLDEAAHARLIQLYGAQGRRGLAEAHYTRCSELLQRELGEAPGEELRAALTDARRRGPGKSVDATPAPPRQGAQERHERPERARHWTRTRWATSAGAAAMALLIGILAWTYTERSIGKVGEAGSYQSDPWDLPARPSIAVLPFENLSGDQEQTYFADGITSDITTNLSKFSTLFVVASHSSFRYRGQAAKAQDVARDLGVRYLLEGSLQRAGDTLRINVNLIDATTGRQVWAERYERPIANVLVVQKEIAQSVAAVIGSGWGQLQRAEMERSARIPTQDLQAYDLYLRGVAYKRRNTKEDNTLAREMFEKAIQADTNYAMAMAECSLTYIIDVFNGWTDSREERLQMAEELARRAVEIDPSEPWGFVALGLVYQLKVRNDEALPLFERAHDLNPNDYYVKEALGYAVTYAGSAERGVELLEQAQRLNPYHTAEHPLSLGSAYFFAHRYRDAIAAINRITSRQGAPAYWLFKAATHAQLGQLDEARAAIAEALKLDPKLTLQGEHEGRLALGLAPAYAEHLTAALRKAGLPERAAHQF